LQTDSREVANEHWALDENGFMQRRWEWV
jgi:hypothetical protein